MSGKKDSVKLVRQLRRQGFVCELSKGHWQVRHNDRFIMAMASTPSDWRALKNNISRLRQHGFIWPPQR